VLPVTFALHEGRIWSAIDEKPKRRDREPARLRFLRERPQVALTVDRYDDDWSRLAWVQVLGAAAVLAAEPGPLAALAEKYEPYRERRPPGPLIAIEPDRILSWSA
jgi:PPOX class probable F420-dependent enzyme